MTSPNLRRGPGPARPIACPRCGQVRTVAANRGAKLRCPGCGAEYPAPSRTPAAAATENPAQPAPPHPLAPPAADAPGEPSAAAAGPRILPGPVPVIIRPAPAPPAGVAVGPPTPEDHPGAGPVTLPRAGIVTAVAGDTITITHGDGTGTRNSHRAGRDRRPIRRRRK